MFGEELLFNRVLQLIKEWKPKRYNGELEYRDSLKEFLSVELNKPKSFTFSDQKQILVKKESGKSHCDISIGQRVNEKLFGIELKFSKNGKLTEQRLRELKGEITEHSKEHKKLIVVLVGKINQETITKVQEKVTQAQAAINNHRAFKISIPVINKSEKK